MTGAGSLQVRAMQRPPHGVKLVIEAVCIMRSIKPKKVAGEKPGTKVDDYWEPGKSLLQDPGKFLEGLFKFDKVCQCPEDTLSQTKLFTFFQFKRSFLTGIILAPISSVGKYPRLRDQISTTLH